MAPPIQVSQIPTLSDLYKDGTFQPSSLEDASLPTPSATLNAKVSLIRTSITTLATTCIVNAANTSLLGGGGVDGAIHSAAGPSLLSECRLLNGCATGSAKLTSAHDLPSSYVIHAVGPIYHRHRKAADKLRSCYRTSLQLALEKGKDTGQEASIAFSCLSTGVYGYPSGEAAEVAGWEVRRFLEELEEEGERKGGLKRVVFCIFEAKDERAYGEWLPKIFPPTPEDIPVEKEPTEAETTSGESTIESASAVSNDNTTDDQPQAKKLKTSTEDLEKDDWEAIEKPSETAAEMSEEGEKVEAGEVGGSDGETLEKPVRDEKYETNAGVAQQRNMLAKDW
ncbi:MAG: hypothetical protein ASARMPREDX12_002745 [Alectoria sarmentosa]|nr:MAG: hypothetical protein ASARMPREDX12_002745 [Alectoria sarmentosa]